MNIEDKIKNFDKIPVYGHPLIETHCHLDYAKSFEIDEILEACQKLNIEKIITIAVCPDNLKLVLEIANAYQNIYCTQGIHPHDAKAYSEEAILTIEKNLSHPKVVAVGEIGLDYHYNLSPQDQQRMVFRKHLELASAHDMPVVIHTREADQDMLAMLKEFAPQLKRKGVIHSFSSSLKLAEQALDLGFHLGFNGIITFKNASEVREAVEYAPINKIIIETDSPYLTPTPFRGRENFSFYLPLVVDMISKVKTIHPDEVCEMTYKNAMNLFRLD